MTDRVIRALPKSLADKIAAGEVVERPLSIVKELLENSIDAGANNITVEIKAGGKEYIRVTDNGCGIPRDQLQLAFMRYATSKIVTEDDLNSIITLGFRGEALASIASVSRVELLTKTSGSKVGSKITLTAGETDSIEDAACEEGTTIIIRDLFFNVPARRKFLKSDNTESSLIIDYVSKMALVCPGVRIRLISNGSILFSTPGKNDVYQAILTVYSPQMARSLVPVQNIEEIFDQPNHTANSESDIVDVSGYISSPTESRTNKRWQIFFVNGRLVKSKMLEQAVAESYKDKLFEGRYPICFLFIKVAPEAVDVNIHPHKTEIRFYNEKLVFDSVKNAVRKSLLNPESLNVRYSPGKEKLQTKTELSKKAVSEKVDIIYIPSTDNKKNSPVYETKPVTILSEADSDKKKAETIVSKNDFFANLRNKSDETGNKLVNQAGANTEIASENKVVNKPVSIETQIQISETDIKTDLIQPKDESSKAFKFQHLRQIGKAFDTYIIASDEKAVYIIDQHAAHERVMYEKLLGSFNKQENYSQQLLVPYVIETDQALKVSAEDLLPQLKTLGFELGEFGPSSYLVKEIPAFMTISESEDFLNAFLEGLSEYKTNIQARKELITSKACKAAVKAHDKLSDLEIKALFEELDKCENPFSCPHGRPVFVRYTEYELEKMFKRK